MSFKAEKNFYFENLEICKYIEAEKFLIFIFASI